MWTPLERSKRKGIIALLKSRGAWVVTTTGVSLAGCPDLIACYRGRFVALEVKREHNGRYGVTKKQQLEVNRLQLAGAYAYVVADKSEVAGILDIIDADL
jgi:Holliday junction resolvase